MTEFKNPHEIDFTTHPVVECGDCGRVIDGDDGVYACLDCGLIWADYDRIDVYKVDIEKSLELQADLEGADRYLSATAQPEEFDVEKAEELYLAHQKEQTKSKESGDVEPTKD